MTLYARLVWRTEFLADADGETAQDFSAQRRRGNVIVDWSDFLSPPSASSSASGILSSPSPVFAEETGASIVVIFFPDGTEGILAIDPYLSVTTSSTTVQVDVPNRYRATMTTNDTTTYLDFADRAQNDSSPDTTFRFNGPYIDEGNTQYHLRQDNDRVTSILEASDTRVKLRVSGCLDTSTGDSCLNAGSIPVGVVEDYTPSRRTACLLPTRRISKPAALLWTIRKMRTDTTGSWVDADVTDAAYDDTANAFYGTGTTETAFAVDTSFEDTQVYVVFPGAKHLPERDGRYLSERLV